MTGSGHRRDVDQRDHRPSLWESPAVQPELQDTVGAVYPRTGAPTGRRHPVETLQFSHQQCVATSRSPGHLGPGTGTPNLPLGVSGPQSAMLHDLDLLTICLANPTSRTCDMNSALLALLYVVHRSGSSSEDDLRQLRHAYLALRERAVHLDISRLLTWVMFISP